MNRKGEKRICQDVVTAVALVVGANGYGLLYLLSSYVPESFLVAADSEMAVDAEAIAAILAVTNRQNASLSENGQDLCPACFWLFWVVCVHCFSQILIKISLSPCTVSLLLPLFVHSAVYLQVRTLIRFP